MGTTLSNGVYLPDEGERNCYAGLKVNWEILNQKVADIVALQLAIAGALHREIVESLPTTDIDPNTIYMILSGTSATENVYDEYMYVNNAWELIGTSATDLTNYYTKAEVDGKLLLKANASDLTSHTGDTTIHVTASDKAKWTNSANTHVLRLALSALTPSTSDNSFSNLDDATALKVGDKVMDTAGVLFEVTAIDTQNSTFTIGTALIDLAQDSDVVHKSGNETIGGVKTFDSNTFIYNSDNTATTPTLYLKSSKIEISSQGNTSGDQNLTYLDKNNTSYAYVKGAIQSNGSAVKIRAMAKDSSNNLVINELQMLAYTNGNKVIFPAYSNEIDLGASSYKWKSIFATNYYYGNDNVEFSTKFVTTDTNQTITGNKTFLKYITSNGSSTGDEYSPNARTNIWLMGNRDTEEVSGILFDSYRQNTAQGTGAHILGISIKENSVRYEGCRFSWGWKNDLNGYSFDFKPTTQGANQALKHNLGTSTDKWSTINGLNPSSLSLPDLSNGIDISSYITIVANANKESLYTPPANGWICVRLSRTSGALGVMLIQGNMASSGKNIEVESGVTTADAMLPVVGGVQVSINSALADGVVSAYFYPCQGNV